ncbi:unnamed protein product [Arabidopsis lyrata]|nr:unnamed protein product [Arabidopsis lyrata]
MRIRKGDKKVVKENDSLVKRSWGQDLKSHLSIETDQSHKSDSQEEGPFGKASRIAELRRRASIESDSTLSSFDSVSELDTLGEVENRGDNIQQNHSTMHHHSVTNDEVDKLKAELVALARRADLSELELQSLRKQIVKETKRSQDLLREVTSLKQERDSLKVDYESIKASDKRKEEAKIRNKLQLEGRDPHVLLEETREELDYEKDLNSNLRLQLQKTQESNTELILAVQDLEAMVGQRSKKTVGLPRPRTCERNTEESRRRPCTSETDDDEDQKALDELVKGHMDAKEAHIEGMEEELEKQAQIFDADLEAVTRAKVEQEHKAIEAEEALRKTRWKNASVAGKIQDEFKRISEQMSSTLAAKEKVTMKAMTETRELRMQKRQLEELLISVNDELGANRVEYEAKLNELSGKTDLKTKEMERKLVDLVEKSKDLENQKKLELEEMSKSSMETKASLAKELHRIKDDKEAEQIKLKENALEASSKMFIEKEKELKDRIEELQIKLYERSQNSQEAGEGPEKPCH